MKLPRRDEDGFTLVELLISVVLLAMLTGATASALVTALNQSRTNTQRVREANDAQVIAAYLVRDAQATGGSNPATGVSDPALGVSTTDAAGCTAPGTLVARFEWRDYFLASGLTSSLHVAAYFYDSSNDTLVRAGCTDGGAASVLTLGSDIGSTPQPPILTCDGGGTCPHFPDTVQLTLYETNNPVTHVPGPYQVVLTASLRPEPQTAASSSNSTPVPLLALGGGVGCGAGAAGLDIEGNPNVRVYGTVDVNATDLSGCSAMVAADPALLFVAGGTSILNGGSCQGLRCPGSIGSFPNPLIDPFASLTPPSATCSGGSNPAPVAGHYHPGTYPQLLSLGGTVVFDPGTYVFCNGVNISGGTITGTGVLWYIKGGQFTATGGTTTLSAATGAYNPLVVWQDANDNLTMSTSGNAALNFAGTLYVPGAIVDLEGTADSSFTSIVAMAVMIQGNHTITLGTPPASPLSITGPATLPAWTRGVAYPATTVTATGGSGINTWSATGLPAGLTINAATGVISGTPTTSGSATVTVKVVDSLGDTASRTYTLTINGPPTISGPASLPSWTVNRDYPGTAITAAGGTTPYTWSATGLPPGVGINATTGVVAGTPSTTGSYNPVITVTDAAGVSATRSYALAINATPSITGPASLPNWTAGRAYPSQTMTATAGTTPYAWAASGLPPGITINPGTGVISGTPTTAGTYAVTVSMTDTAGATATRAYSVMINPAPIVGTTSLPNGELTVPYSATLSPGSGTPPYSWSATGLPPGLTLNPSTGVLAGTPTTAGTFNSVKITVTDATGASGSRTYTVVIAALPSITGPASLSTWTVGRDYPGTQIIGTNGTTPYAWSATGLPSGLAINAATGVIAGTPAANGSFSVTVTLTDADGVTASRAYTLVINTAPTITTSSLPNGEQGIAYSKAMAATSGTTPYSWAASGLPPGLTMSTAGVLSGTPTAAGTYSVTITVSDAAGATATNIYSLTLNPPPTITGPATLPSSTVGAPYPPTTVVATGGTTPYAWSASGLPAGLTINASTGVISGTPTATGTKSVTVTVTDALGATASRSYGITVNAGPSITGPSSLPVGTVGYAYPATTIIESGGTAPFSWSATQLPAGLSIDPASGVISGTPTTAGTSAATVTVTDGSGATASRGYTVTIKAPPTVTSTSPASRGQGATNASITINGTGFVSGASLGAAFSGSGITVNSVTFGSATQVTANITIATSAATGTRDVVLTNGDGTVAIGTGVFTVNAGPTVASINPTSRAKGSSGTETIAGTGFVAGATVAFVPGGSNPGGNAPSVTSTTVNNSGQITVTITIANGNPARGTYDVVVTNPDGGRATLPGGFTVT